MMPWRLRRDFWNLLAILKYRTNRPAVIPVPTDDGHRLGDVSFVSQFPGIPIHNIRVADRVPDDEVNRLRYRFYELQVALYRLFPPMQPGLPSRDEDPHEALHEAYTPAHRRLFPAPEVP